MGKIHPSVLHQEHIAKCLTRGQRRENKVMTADEAAEKAKAGEEKRLQDEVRQYLNLLGVEMINPSMHRRSQLPKGWPDFTFSYYGFAFAVECKTEAGRLSEDQQKMRTKLTSPPNCWRYILATRLDDVRDQLNLTHPKHEDDLRNI